ncbi:adenylate/guanylate cyclase domain-containing protein [Bradyrhizobium sp. LHD-71]|uniref:adenylate/guanylate cyclase domain-containing protein n=1 Tax=Bradyrhizobium sp. LHD-71 TaxID=3072141 RepID=UPI00280E9738|nr:adenylate/guanylate cyclase domain-containing protein [Bradyrhizobium sp. LHD-71]MDQ8731754.1 adenylate/guanylate cyclase domain-containing protein [Bradyrhizobium sp. LHD-71]
MRSWWRPQAAWRGEVSPEFSRAFVREVLNTERVRMKALIVTSVIGLAVVTTVSWLHPQFVEQVWKKQFSLFYLYAIFVPFIIVESIALAVVSWERDHRHDIPYIRRYLNALVETSLPTIVLGVQMMHMGDERALGFIVPMLYFMFITLSTLRLDFWLSTFTGAVAAAEMFAMAMFFPAFHASAYDPWSEVGFHVARSVVLLGGGVLAGAVAAQLRRQFASSIAAATARDRVTNLFGQHVSPQVVERLLTAKSDDAADRHNVAVMFVDIRSFTAAARQRKPEEVVQRLDRAFEVLVDVIDRNGGIVNKFLGDGFLALFGAPLEDPDAGNRAVTAAREILQAMERENAASDWPLRLGIGIHIGEVVAGNVGSSRRKEYTVIGDTVNFAARLEALNKEYGSQLLVSSNVYAAARDGSGNAVSLGEIAVRGYDQPVAVWRLA